MAHQKVEQRSLGFEKGLNTDAPLINFPEGFTSDEQNMELLLDGSRRRRRGIAEESEGATLTISPSYNFAIRSFPWNNVNGNSDVNYIALQVGGTVYFFNNDIYVSTTLKEFSVDLIGFKTSGSSDEQVRTTPVEMTYGRGHLIIVGKYIEPLLVRYIDSTGDLDIAPIDMKERDFVGVDDGINNETRPVTLTDSHNYNLLNAGWRSADITTFKTNEGVYPSKNMIPWMGYRRLTNASYADADGIKEFSSDKLMAELFQDAPAPTGHYIQSIFDTTISYAQGGGATFAVSNWTTSGDWQGGPETLTCTTDGNHGLSIGDTVVVDGSRVKYTAGRIIRYHYFDGSYTVASVPSATTFTISVTFPDWANGSLNQKGTVTTSTISNPDGSQISARPEACAFYAGRVFYAGIQAPKLTSRIYFSQIIQSDSQYGKCYQVADPTSEEISDLVASDGGYIIIPEIERVYRMVPYGDGLLVFAREGVWAIGPGDRGYFSAADYSVRKITDRGAVSATAIVVGENTPMYWAEDGIYAIAQNFDSGFLVAQNTTRGRIEDLYFSIPEQHRTWAEGVYDDLNQRFVWIHGTGSNSTSDRSSALIFDTRFGAYTKWTFSYSADTYLLSVFPIKNPTVTDRTSKLKFFYKKSATQIEVGELNGDDFYDFYLSNDEKAAYVISGAAVPSDAARTKYAPYIHVFMGRTETGYTTSAGGDLVPIRPSSITLQTRWDWTSQSFTGDWGTAVQVYRPHRLYTPSGPVIPFDNGYPVVVTRNRLRGSGRALNLKFEAGTGSDAWLLGYHIQYGINTDF